MSATTCCSNCGCNPCGCGSCNYIVVLPSETPVQFAFSNINLTGIGVLAGVSSPNVNFRGVASANGLLTVTLDAGNNAILLTVDATAIAAALPAATTTQVGVLETATNAEAIAKVATDKIVTPSNFSAMASTTSFAGLVELATNAETQLGSSAVLAVTPAGLKSVTDLLNQTVRWADSVARAATVPLFEGQFGYQLDTLNAYAAWGTNAGEWNNLLTFGQTNVIPAAVTTAITLGAGSSIDITGGSELLTTFTSEWVSSTLRLSTNSVLDFDGTDVQVGGSSISANSVVITGGTPGNLSNKLINTFISTSNVQTGWAVTNPSVSRTLDVSAATLGDVRAVLGTLINDLKAVLLPAT